MNLLFIVNLISILSIIIINNNKYMINKHIYIKKIGLLTTIIALYAGLYINYNFNNDVFGYQFLTNYLDINWGIDGISLWLINLNLILVPLAILSNWNNLDKEKIFIYIIIMILLGFIITLNFICLDLISFYILFEATLIPLFILIHIFGSNNKEKAAYYIFIFTLFSSLFMLLSIGIYIYLIGNIDFINIHNVVLSIDLQSLLFIGLIIGIAVKTPIFPVHTWLPLVHAESPIGGSILLAGIIIKLAIYAIIRLLLVNLSDAVILYNPLIYTIAIITLFYIGFITLKQVDIKVIIAYSSIVHMTIAILSVFSGNVLGIEGSLLLCVAHGLTSPALFVLVGAILYDRYHTRFIYYYQSLATYMPIFSVYLLIAGLFNMGLPLSANFIGEFLSINGIFVYNTLFAVLSTFSIFITAVYQLKLTTKMLYGYKSIYINVVKDVNKRELLILNILFFFILLFGILPSLLTNTFTMSVSSLIYMI